MLFCFVLKWIKCKKKNNKKKKKLEIERSNYKAFAMFLITLRFYNGCSNSVVESITLLSHYTHLSRELNSFSSSEVFQKGLESVIYWLSLWPWSDSPLTRFPVYQEVVNCILLFSKIFSWSLKFFLSAASATNSRYSIFSLSFTLFSIFK